jgi:hypothetical protein
MLVFAGKHFRAYGTDTTSLVMR